MRQQEMAQNMKLGVETQERYAAQGVLTKKLGLSRFVPRMADSVVFTFSVVFDYDMLRHI